MSCRRGSQGMVGRVLLRVEQFTALPSPALGLLVGLRVPCDHTTGSDVISHVILGRCSCVPQSRDLPSLSRHGLCTPQWEESWKQVRGCFPGGCDVCGVWVGVEGGEKAVKEVMKDLLDKTDLPILMGDRSVVVIAAPLSAERSMQVYEVGSAAALHRVSVADVGDYLSTHTHLLRVTSSLPAHIKPHHTTREELLASLPDTPPTFHIPSLHLLLPHPHTSPPHKTLRALLQNNISLHSTASYLPVELSMTYQTTGSLTLSLSSPYSTRAQLYLPIDALALVHLDFTLHKVGVALWEAVQRQLHAVATAMLWKGSPVYNVAVHHFPPSIYHLSPISLPYPHTPVDPPSSSPLSDSSLVSVREAWHTALCLPQDRPLLRITNTHHFTHHTTSQGLYSGPQLLCPHSTLKYTAQGTVAVVTGQYAYYHYMQDNFNDSGWGCAYRSLQTLWSWFNLQGFTLQAPPTHKQIQEALVATGDKPADFVGSHEWIGSFEVSTVLNHLLGVESRIHHVSSGSEMAGVGRVLLHHFTSHGTPVMVGGGVLAHTILGVDYNTSTGAIRFLILDPHYTGKDDLKIIISKGWCSWKAVGFWDKKAHYNMCMPQRPRGV